MALSAILKGRMVVYAFCLLMCIVIGGIGGRLLALNVGSKIILLLTVGLDILTAISIVGLMLNTAFQTLKTKPTRDVSGFKIFMHMFLFAIHLLLAGLILKNRVDIKCGDPPTRLLIATAEGTMDLLIVYPETFCKLHDALFILVWVQYAAIATSLTLCILAIDDLRRKIKDLRLWNRVRGKDTTPLPRHNNPHARKKGISQPTSRRSFVFRSRGEPREAPSRLSWISAKAREPVPPPLPPMSELPPLPPLPPATYEGHRDRVRAPRPNFEASPIPYRTYAVFSSGRTPQPQPQPVASSSRLPMGPLVSDVATYAQASTRRAALANVHDSHLTPLPTKPLSERIPRRPANYRPSLANTRNQI